MSSAQQNQVNVGSHVVRSFLLCVFLLPHGIAAEILQLFNKIQGHHLLELTDDESRDAGFVFSQTSLSDWIFPRTRCRSLFNHITRSEKDF